jgi:amino acid adenylation domain-containing protein
VVEIARPPRSLAHEPIFQTMLAWQNHDEGALDLPGLTTTPVSAPRAHAIFDLTLSLAEADGRIVGELEYATALFDRATIERHLGYLRRLLEAMAADESRAIDRLPLLDEAERHRVLVEWNATEAEHSGDACVPELFEAQAARTPEAIAVVCEGQRLTYGELNTKANRLAHHLRALGVRPDDRVAICVERSLEMVVGLLAILKAGGAYVPLDPGYPAERLAFVLKDSAPIVALTHGAGRAALEESLAGLANRPPVVAVEEEAAWIRNPATNPDPAEVGLISRHLAYVIYTSGSTGQPKGVMVEHRNVVRLFTATESWFRFDENDVWMLFHSFAFDFSVWEIWGALIHGGRLVVVPRSTTRSPQDFYALLCQERVTVLNHTPSAFSQHIAAQQESGEEHCLRYVIFGGEALNGGALKDWFRDGRNRHARLINMYGITETTVHVTYYH